jgi:1-acyl-sn-glycerol-3-phosphate acyltransferase
MVLAAANYYWRLLMTGAAFMLFSAGGAAASYTVFPVLRLLPGGAKQRERRVRWVICRLFALLAGFLRITGVMRLETRGLERLQRAGGVLVLANHPSYLDIVVLLSAMPRATCVVKEAWWSNPFIAGVVRAAGYICNSDPEQVLEACDRALREGAAVVVFPEGTRSRPNEPLKFLRGAAHIALKSGRPIVPVLLQCDPPTLTKGSRWYEIPAQPFRFRVTVREELAPASLADLRQPSVLAARCLTLALESYFSQELRAL